MRFPVAALFFLIMSFIFFMFFVFGSFLIGTVHDSLFPFVQEINEESLNDQFSVIPVAFGIISLLFFIIGIFLVFFLESTSDEPEYYWRGPP